MSNALTQYIVSHTVETISMRIENWAQYHQFMKRGDVDLVTDNEVIKMGIVGFVYGVKIRYSQEENWDMIRIVHRSGKTKFFCLGCERTDLPPFCNTPECTVKRVMEQ